MDGTCKEMNRFINTWSNSYLGTKNEYIAMTTAVTIICIYATEYKQGINDR